jgi:hypothetical protein
MAAPVAAILRFKAAIFGAVLFKAAIFSAVFVQRGNCQRWFFSTPYSGRARFGAACFTLPLRWRR